MFKKAILIFSFLLPLIMVAQDVEVINHKGTKIKIANNRVTTATSAPTTPAPFKGDIWIDNTDPQNLVLSLWDGSEWQIIENQESKTIILNSNVEKTLARLANKFYNLPLTSTDLMTINTDFYSISGNSIRILKSGNYLISGEISASNMPRGNIKFILAVYQNNSRIGYLSRGFTSLPRTDFWGTTGTLMYKLNANDVINVKYFLGVSSIKSNFINIGITKI